MGAFGAATAAAKLLKLDMKQYNDCYSGGKFKQAVQQDQDLGIASGVGGTPAFYINGMHLNGAQPFSEFQRVIDSASAKN